MPMKEVNLNAKFVIALYKNYCQIFKDQFKTLAIVTRAHIKVVRAMWVVVYRDSKN